MTADSLSNDGDAEDWFIPGRKARTGRRAQSLVDATCDAYHAHVQPKRRRPETRRKIEAVVCDLLRAHLRGILQLRIRIDERHYSDAATSCYRHPVVEARSFREKLDVLRSLGVVEWTLHNKLARDQGGGVARMRAGPWLKAKIEELGPFSRDDIDRDHEAPTIILKSEKPTWAEAQKGAPPASKRVYFVPTARSKQLGKQIRDVNEWIASFDLTLCTDGLDSSRLPSWADARQRCLYRVFTHGRTEFDRYGRMHGGFWINMPREERWRISLNDEPIVQLDVSAMFLRLLYAKEGVEPPKDDLYRIDAVDVGYGKRRASPAEAQALARQAVKTLINARLFDKGERKKYPRRKPDDPLRLWPSPGKGEMKPDTMLAAIEQHHPAIKHHFGTGIGHELFLAESDIMLLALEKCREPRISALPVHDAILAPLSRHKQAARLVADAFREQTDAWPVIKATLLASPAARGFLADIGTDDEEGALRSSDGTREPRWSLPLSSATLPRYQLRHGAPAISDAIGELYATHRDELLAWASCRPETGDGPSQEDDITWPATIDEMEPAKLIEMCLRAMAIIEVWVRRECAYERLDNDNRSATDANIENMVKRSRTKLIMQLSIKKRRELGKELEQKVAETSPHSKAGDAIY